VKRLARAAVISRLADRLHEQDSWAGETHLQKATYFLQEAVSVPLGYDFVLYKHGPFAFDLRDDLSSFAADRFIEVKPQRYPYGPRLETSENGRALQARFPKTLRAYGDAVDQVAAFIGDRGVGALERLGTALMLLKERYEESDDELAASLTDIKPHVTQASAVEAIREVRGFLRSLQEAGLASSAPQN
jgi:uncharacterized protein YwgA